MALSRLGNFLELVDVRNNENIFHVDDLRGISINKILTPTKANTTNLDLRNYKVVKRDWFCYCTVTSRNGNKISIAFNDGNDCIVSSINPVFKVKENSGLIPRYLMMYFCRAEFDRYARFNSWGSARETFSWEDFCDIELEIPSLEIQKKFVAIYEGLLANLRSYERGLDDLKLVCDGYVEDLRKKYEPEEIKNYITEVNDKNNDGKIDNVLGISINGFIKPNQKPGDLKNYYVFSHNNIVYSPPRINVGSIGIYKENAKAVCSPIYVIFKVKDEQVLNPDYLMIWLKRAEFLRSTDFYSIASVRNNFSYELMENVKICIPPLNIQNYIVNVHKSLIYRRSNVDKLKQLISSMCPILIRGSIEEANKEA